MRRGPQRIPRLPRFNGGSSVLPSRYHAVLETQWCGYVIAGDITGTGNFADVQVNAGTQPFQANNTWQFTGSSGATPFAGTNAGGSAMTNNPIGYNFFTSNYGNYKIDAYEAEVTITPQNSGDTIAMALFPLGSQELPSTGNWTYYRAAAQVGAKSGVAINGANSRLNTLRIKGSIPRDLGLTDEQWENIPPTAAGSNPTGALNAFVGIFLSTLDGGSNASPVVVLYKMRQWVTWGDRIQLGN